MFQTGRLIEIPAEFLQSFTLAYDALVREEDRAFYGVRYGEYGAAVYHAPPEKGMTVLDVGCGENYFILYAAASGATVRGIDDGSFRALYPAWRKTLDAYHVFQEGRIEIVDGNAASLPYADAFFDVVYTFSALEHFIGGDDIRCVHEVYRVLKPGGLFVGTVDFNHATTRPTPVTYPMCRAYTFDGFLEMVLPAGFELTGPALIDCPVEHYLSQAGFFVLRPRFK